MGREGHKQNTQNSLYRVLCSPPSTVLYGHHVIMQLRMEDGRKHPVLGKNGMKRSQQVLRATGFRSPIYLFSTQTFQISIVVL